MESAVKRRAILVLMTLATISLMLGARLLESAAANAGLLAVVAGAVLAGGALVGAWRAPHSPRGELGPEPE